MTDPWIGILKALEPDYERLHNMSSKSPIINPEIWKNARNKWAITLQEHWDHVALSEGPHTVDFHDIVFWSDIELKKWDCIRTSYDTWQFKSKRDAEKFKTLFLLKWPL